jgi:hypothetical protein
VEDERAVLGVRAEDAEGDGDGVVAGAAVDAVKLEGGIAIEFDGLVDGAGFDLEGAAGDGCGWDVRDEVGGFVFLDGI